MTSETKPLYLKLNLLMLCDMNYVIVRYGGIELNLSNNLPILYSFLVSSQYKDNHTMAVHSSVSVSVLRAASPVPSLHSATHSAQNREGPRGGRSLTREILNLLSYVLHTVLLTSYRQGPGTR